MDDRRLVGIDLGITSAHTVRVLSGDGTLVCRRKAIPTVDSLEQVEQAALAETPAGTLLEVVVEPTGPAWLPIAVFFCARGHTVYRVSSAKAHDLRRVLSRHATANGIDADTLAASRWSTRPGCTPSRCRTQPGRRWTAACGRVIGSPGRPPPTSAASRIWSSSCCRPAL
jgi:transposase